MPYPANTTAPFKLALGGKVERDEILLDFQCDGGLAGRGEGEGAAFTETRAGGNGKRLQIVVPLSERRWSSLKLPCDVVGRFLDFRTAGGAAFKFGRGEVADMGKVTVGIERLGSGGCSRQDRSE